MRNRHTASTAAPVAKRWRRIRPFRWFFLTLLPFEIAGHICVAEAAKLKGDTYLRESSSSESECFSCVGIFFQTFAFVEIMNKTAFLQSLKTIAKSGWCTCGRKKKKQMPISSFLHSLYCYAWLKLQNIKTECFFFVISSIRLYNEEKLRDALGKRQARASEGRVRVKGSMDYTLEVKITQQSQNSERSLRATKRAG